MSNYLELYAPGAGEEEVKIYTGRANTRPHSAHVYPSHDPVIYEAQIRQERKRFRVGRALANARDAIHGAVERLNISDEAKFFLTLAAKYLLILLIFAGYSMAVYKIGASRADKDARADAARQYAEQFQAYIQEQEDAAEAARIAAANAKQSEAEIIARVFYGVEGVNTSDLRTLAWCIFNRVDNPRFGNTVHAVITEEGQFEMYRANYPVIEEYYQIASEELDRWRNGSRRPVSNDYVYMKWTGAGIELRDNFEETGTTRTWRFK